MGGEGGHKTARGFSDSAPLSLSPRLFPESPASWLRRVALYKDGLPKTAQGTLSLLMDQRQKMKSRYFLPIKFFPGPEPEPR